MLFGKKIQKLSPWSLSLSLSLSLCLLEPTAKSTTKPTNCTRNSPPQPSPLESITHQPQKKSPSINNTTTTQTQIKLTKLKSKQPKLKLPANHHHQHNQIFHSHHHRFENPPTLPISKINLKTHHQSTNLLPSIGKPMISKLTTISKSGTDLIRGTREG